VSLTEANGVLFHTQILGEGEPVVLIHGLFASNLAEWYFTAAPVIARTRRVLLYDLRGHGRSERTAGGYDLQSMVADLHALLESFDEHPVAVCGYSYGGLIALRFALEQPQRVKQLALIETPLPPSRLAEIDPFSSENLQDLLDASPRVHRTVSLGGRRAIRLFQNVQSMVFETSMLQDLGAETDISDEELARVSCPVLCLYGDASPCLPTGKRLVRVLPNPALTVLRGGHALFSDAPAAITSCLEKFLNG
jgi:pimeloyl-ACP methyl ester carboxylesterase